MARRLTRSPPRERRRLDRATLILAIAALGTVGGVAFIELGRRLRRRARHDGDGGLIAAAPAAASDVVTVAKEGYGAASERENALFNLLSGFVISSALVRLTTHGSRAGWWPVGPLEWRGRHIHHFVPGILLAFATGGWALVTRDEGIEAWLAIPFGVGMGLTFDEAALLLDLEDVYFSPEGLLSIQISLGTAALLGATILALRIIKRGEEAVES